MTFGASIHPDRPVFHPGETFRATLDLYNKSQTAYHGAPGKERSARNRSHTKIEPAVSVVEVTVVAHGIEKIDPLRVATNYYNSDSRFFSEGRKLVRYLFQTKPENLATPPFALSRGEDRRLSISFSLPKNLPPSFRGTAVQYRYEIEVFVNYSKILSSKDFGVGNEEVKNKDEIKEAGQTYHVKSAFNILPEIPAPPTACLEGDVDGRSEEGLKVDVEFLTEEIQIDWMEIVDEDKLSSKSTEGSSLGSRLASCSTDTVSVSMMSCLNPPKPSLTQSGSHHSRTESEKSFTTGNSSGHSGLHRRSSSGDISLQMLKDSSFNTYNSCTYVLRIEDTYLGVFSLNPVALTPMVPGSTFGGVLDFRVPQRVAASGISGHKRGGDHEIAIANRKVLGFSVMLESEEDVKNKWVPAALRSRKSTTICKLYCEHAEVTSDVLVTSFMFTIPMMATPSFSSPLVSFKWCLKFEFCVGDPINWEEDEDGTVFDEAERLNWRLPIKVHSL